MKTEKPTVTSPWALFILRGATTTLVCDGKCVFGIFQSVINCEPSSTHLSSKYTVVWVDSVLINAVLLYTVRRSLCRELDSNLSRCEDLFHKRKKMKLLTVFALIHN